MRVALVLAAGASRRFGARDKLAARIAGRSLIAHSLDRARASGARRILLVTRRPTAAFPGCRPVRARRAAAGIGASLLAGLAAVRPIERELLIFLADTPFAAAPRGRCFALRAGIDAIRPTVGHTPGHPLLVRTAVAQALATAADRGIAGGIVRARLAAIAGGPGHILDVDTPRALARLRHRIAVPGGAFRLLGSGETICRERDGRRRRCGSRPPRR